MIGQAEPRVRGMGRPSSFTPEVAAEICERLANGESLRGICAGEDMPGMSTVFRWLGENETFREQYARAREAQADTLADEIVHIADTPMEGATVTSKEWGDEVKRGDMIEHRKLRVDARKWFAAKLAPKKYGDKQQVDLNAKMAISDMTEDEMRAELAALVSQGFVPSAANDCSDLV